MHLRLRTRTPFVVMAGAELLVWLTTLGWKQWGPEIVINATPSAPQGLYRLIEHPEQDYRRGMVVVFPVPVALRPIVYGRHWLKSGVPFLKEIQGLTGDRICIRENHLEVNERVIGPVFRVDRTGQALPQITGCFEVPPGYFFAANSTFAQSFDGRYFGALPLSIVRAEARALWIF
jgi:signal peptidase I